MSNEKKKDRSLRVLRVTSGDPMVGGLLGDLESDFPETLATSGVAVVTFSRDRLMTRDTVRISMRTFLHRGASWDLKDVPYVVLLRFVSLREVSINVIRLDAPTPNALVTAFLRATGERIVNDQCEHQPLFSVDAIVPYMIAGGLVSDTSEWAHCFSDVSAQWFIRDIFGVRVSDLARYVASCCGVPVDSDGSKGRELVEVLLTFMENRFQLEEDFFPKLSKQDFARLLPIQHVHALAAMYARWCVGVIPPEESLPQAIKDFTKCFYL